MNITQEQLRNIIKESIAPLLKVKELKLTLTIAEAAQISGIGRDKLTELIVKGDVPHFKVGAKTLINREKFISWLDKITVERKTL
jgi:excisionase family DNA binding protein